MPEPAGTWSGLRCLLAVGVLAWGIRGNPRQRSYFFDLSTSRMWDIAAVLRQRGMEDRHLCWSLALVFGPEPEDRLPQADRVAER